MLWTVPNQNKLTLTLTSSARLKRFSCLRRIYSDLTRLRQQTGPFVDFLLAKPMVIWQIIFRETYALPTRKMFCKNCNITTLYYILQIRILLVFFSTFDNKTYSLTFQAITFCIRCKRLPMQHTHNPRKVPGNLKNGKTRINHLVIQIIQHYFLLISNWFSKLNKG